MKTVDLSTSDVSAGLPGDSAIALLFKDHPFVPAARSLPVPSAPVQSARLPATQVSVSVCLAGSLRNRWALYLGRRQQFEQEPSEEAVHELRVTTRRLIAQLDVFSAVVPSPEAEKGRRILKRSLKPLGRLRDIQVQRTFVEQQLEAFPELILFLDDLKKRETPRIIDATEKVNGLRLRRFEKWITLMFQALADNTNNARHETRLSSDIARVLEKSHAAAVRRRREIQEEVPDTIHATRVAFKKDRYVVESFSPGFTGFDERQLGALAAYQRRMGTIQDLEIIHSGVTRFIARYQAADEFLGPFLEHLGQLRARALVSFMKQADQIFEFRVPTST